MYLSFVKIMTATQATTNIRQMECDKIEMLEYYGENKGGTDYF